MMFSSFCCCTIERDPFAQHLEHFYERGVLELDLLPCDKIQDGTVKEVCSNDDLFSFKSFRICSKNQKIIGWMVLLQSLKENSSLNLLCHRNTGENATDFQS